MTTTGTSAQSILERDVIGLTRAKEQFNSITARANETGREVLVMKRNAPWVKIVPLAASGAEAEKKER